MKHSASHRGFDHFLGHQREEEHHADVVHGERDAVGEAVVALRLHVHPDHRDQGAKRQQQQVLDGELREAWNRTKPGTAPAALVTFVRRELR